MITRLQVWDILIIVRATSITCSIGGCRSLLIHTSNGDGSFFHPQLEWDTGSLTCDDRTGMWILQSWRDTPACQSLKLVMEWWWPCYSIESYNKVYVVWLCCNLSNFHNTDYGVQLPQFHQVPNNQMIIITGNVGWFTPTWGCVFCSWRNSPTILSLSRYYYGLFNIIMFFFACRELGQCFL